MLPAAASRRIWPIAPLEACACDFENRVTVSGLGKDPAIRSANSTAATLPIVTNAHDVLAPEAESMRWRTVAWTTSP